MNQRVEAFARVSARKTFQRGCCLPGTVWQRGEPVVIDNLQNPTLFSRSSLARECGLEAGFGLPIRRGPEVAHVLVMLSAQATPLVRSFEAWVLEGNELRLDRSLGARVTGPSELAPAADAELGKPFIERLVESPVPLVFERRPLGSLGALDLTVDAAEGSR